VTGFSAALGGACWLGILTSISPCLLATNVTAIGFISRRLDQPRLVALSGTCYMAGQALGFIVLAALITGSIASVPLLSHGLQKYMFRLLGPIMLVTGLLLLEFIKIEFGRGRLKGWAQRFGEGGGALGNDAPRFALRHVFLPDDGRTVLRRTNSDGTGA